MLPLLGACAWGPGQPFSSWSQASLALAWASEAGRLDEAGRWRTAEGWSLSFSAPPSLSEGQLQVLGAGAGSGAPAAAGGGASFDPAKPPPGYTLCHGGHCHSASGALVSYEAIQAELSGGGAAPTAPVLGSLRWPEALALGQAPAWLAGPDLASGRLQGLKATGTLRLAGLATATAGAPRGAKDLLAFELSFPVQALQSLPPGAAQGLGPAEAPGLVGQLGGLRRVGIEAKLLLPPTLLDGLDWARLADAAASGLPSRLEQDASSVGLLREAAAGLQLQALWSAPAGPAAPPPGEATP